MSNNVIKAPARTPKMNAKPKDQLAAFTYVLYLYREELRKPRQSWMSRARSKFLLTHELVNKNMRNKHKCSPEDLRALAREREFKNNLYYQITRTKHQHNIQMLQHERQLKNRIQQGPKQQQQQQRQPGPSAHNNLQYHQHHQHQHHQHQHHQHQHHQHQNHQHYQHQQYQHHHQQDQQMAKRVCGNDYRTTSGPGRQS